MISIIVPVYNAEKYLEICLDSLVSQTYTDIEIVCVDDGSKDNSAAILHDYSQMDSRIKIIKQKNSGASVARNTGLDNCTGDYIMFVDSDDWIEPDTCQTALAALTENNADVVMWDYIRELSDKSVPKNIYNGDIIFEGADIEKKLRRRMIGVLDDEITDPTFMDSLSPIWGKLYKTSVIHNAGTRFYDIKHIGSHEDGLFNLDVFGSVKKAIYVNKFLHHYRKTNADSITTKYNPKYKAQREHLYSYMHSYITDNNLGNDYKKALENRIALETLFLGLNTAASGQNVVRNIKTFLSEEPYHKALQQLNTKFLPIHWKVFYFCSKNKLPLFSYLLLRAIAYLKNKI